MNLYGQDMDESVTPLESGLGWTVDLASARDFVGKAALVAKPPARELRGLLLLDKGGVLRAHQRVRTAHGDGEITSGTFSPTLAASIALARLPAAVRRRRRRPGGRPRPGTRRARRQAAVRAQRQGAGGVTVAPWDTDRHSGAGRGARPRGVPRTAAARLRRASGGVHVEPCRGVGASGGRAAASGRATGGHASRRRARRVRRRHARRRGRTRSRHARERPPQGSRVRHVRAGRARRPRASARRWSPR